MKEKRNKVIDKIFKFGYDHPKVCSWAGSIGIWAGLFFYGLSCSTSACRHADNYWKNIIQLKYVSQDAAKGKNE